LPTSVFCARAFILSHPASALSDSPNRHALFETVRKGALGERTREASSRDSASSRPLGSLLKRPRAAAETPWSSPLKVTRFTYASRISSFVHFLSRSFAAVIWSHFCVKVLFVPLGFNLLSTTDASCIVIVLAPRG